MAFSGSQTTRLGLWGGARSPYASFAGKPIFGGSVIVVSSLQGDRGTVESLLGDSPEITSLLGKKGSISFHHPLSIVRGRFVLDRFGRPILDRDGNLIMIR